MKGGLFMSDNINSLKKIAVTAYNDSSSARVDSRFICAAYFMLYNQVDAIWDCLDNRQNLKETFGISTKSAQALAQTGANVLITGYIGPKAFKLLQSKNISIYSALSGTVEEVLSAFLEGKLIPITVPNALDVKKIKYM